MKIEYIVIAIVLIIILLALIKTTTSGAKLNYNNLVELLGGTDNIIDTIAITIYSIFIISPI